MRVSVYESDIVLELFLSHLNELELSRDLVREAGNAVGHLCGSVVNIHTLVVIGSLGLC